MIFNISAEISTNVNKEHKKSTLTSPCHYCKEEATNSGLCTYPLTSENDEIIFWNK
jgi:hypothetical protein